MKQLKAASAVHLKRNNSCRLTWSRRMLKIDGIMTFKDLTSSIAPSYAVNCLGLGVRVSSHWEGTCSRLSAGLTFDSGATI